MLELSLNRVFWRDSISGVDADGKTLEARHAVRLKMMNIAGLANAEDAARCEK